MLHIPQSGDSTSILVPVATPTPTPTLTDGEIRYGMSEAVEARRAHHYVSQSVRVKVNCLQGKTLLPSYNAKLTKSGYVIDSAW